jgi:hypothetical protein
MNHFSWHATLSCILFRTEVGPNFVFLCFFTTVFLCYNIGTSDLYWALSAMNNGDSPKDALII